MKKIVGYRLLDRTEKMRAGDVLGSARKTPIIVSCWAGQEAGNCNQPVYRPMSSFKDFFPEGQGDGK